MSSRVIKENIIFNVCKTLMTVLYPIITFIYMVRIISTEMIGSITFSKNFTSYFCLLASLGINYYGIREGAKVVQNKKKFSQLFWEIFIINFITTCISLCSFIYVIIFWQEVDSYKVLLLINLPSIILCGLSNEWVLGAIEKYKFISIRTMITQIICVAIMLVLVRRESDYIIYAILLVVAGYGPSVFNWIYIYKINIIEKINWKEIHLKKHLKPILIMFAMLLSIDMYTLLDTTMLGLIKGDRAVGLYSVAIKIPRLINSMIASVGVVLVPRISFYYEVDRNRFNKLVHNAMSFVFMISIPLAVGTFVMGEEILCLIAGEEYIKGVITLRILTMLILFIPVSVLFNNQVFIPMRKELYVLKSTCAGAIVNLVSNMILIPRFAENGAALGSVLAEFTVMCICIYYVRKTLDVKKIGWEYIKRLFVGIAIIPGLLVVKFRVDDIFIRLVVAILLSGSIFTILSLSDIKKIISDKSK